MMRTSQHNEQTYKIAVNTDTLADMLDCGKATARKIGTAANAKIQIGRRVLWNASKVQEYLDAASSPIFIVK